MSFDQTFFRLSGRISRGQFWTAFTMWVFVAVPLVATLVVFYIGRIPGQRGLWYLPDPEANIFILMFFHPLLAITVKRLHDHDKSGWWSLLMIVVPVCIAVAMLPLWGQTYVCPPPSLWIGLGVVALLLLAWWAIELGARPGTPGPNRFGPADYPAIGSAPGTEGE